jgi:hypothetical protein
MNPWQVFGASVLGMLIAVACSQASKEEPSGDSGSAGAPAAGRGGDASAGASGGISGGSAEGGSGGGADVAPGGSGSGGGAAEPEGGAGGVPPSGPYLAEQGRLCPVHAVIGVVQLAGFPSPYVQVTLHDRPDPWIGEAELSAGACEFHRFTADACGACDTDEVCAIEGRCVPQRRTVKQATLSVRTGLAERRYQADPDLGGIYSTLDIGDSASSYAMTLSWSGTEVQLAPMAVASGELQDARVTIEGDYSQPGALEASWTPSDEGAFVRSRIPINHHAAGPTFTECSAPDSAGGFHADAEMIDPLAVQTGLEFQGLEHVRVAAATTPDGCVEFRFGPQLHIFPD